MYVPLTREPRAGVLVQFRARILRQLDISAILTDESPLLPRLERKVIV